jgi:hypothetical protein
MVVVACDYYRGAIGPTQVAAIGVLDPWPGSPAYHPLSPLESIATLLGGEMTFLAAVRVSP